MTRCEHCRHHIWPWQKWGGYGPLGFRLRDADVAWHNRCLLANARARHAETGCTQLCRLVGCPENAGEST